MFTKKMLLHRCIPKATTKISLNNNTSSLSGTTRKELLLNFYLKTKMYNSCLKVFIVITVL